MTQGADYGNRYSNRRTVRQFDVIVNNLNSQPCDRLIVTDCVVTVRHKSPPRGDAGNIEVVKAEAGAELC